MNLFIVNCCLLLQELKRKDPKQTYTSKTQKALRDLIKKHMPKYISPD